MSSTTTGPFRIANLLPPSYSAGYAVPAWAVGAGFTSEIFDLSTEASFINDLDRAVTGLAYAEAGIRAQSAGFAAVFINTVGDYGIRELRAALQIPVVGAGQASFHVAAGLADRFGVLTVWPRVTGTIYRRLISDYGFGERCIGVRHVAENEELADMVGENGLIDEMRDLRAAALDRLERGGRDLLEQGAEALVLGCTCMSPAADELRDRLGCVLVDPLTTGHKFAEMLVGLRLSQAAAPVPTTLDGLLAGLFARPASAPGSADEDLADEDLCGDTCSIIGSPATASA